MRGTLSALDNQVKIEEADTQETVRGPAQIPKLPDQANLPVAANAQLPGQAPGAGQQTKETYANLFPQDTLGQAIANRNVQRPV